MALYINLYHEIEKAEQDRRRDPVKLATLAGIGIAALFLLYYLYRLGAVGGVHSQASGMRAEWAKLEPQQTTAIAREAQLAAQLKANQALMDRLQGRFLWGPFFQVLAGAVPPEVQITSFTGTAPTATKPADILIVGLAAGQEPRGVAEKFRLGVQQKFSAAYSEVSAKFDANSLDDSPVTVKMKGQTLSTASFRIRLLFKKTSTVAATLEPAPAHHRK